MIKKLLVFSSIFFIHYFTCHSSGFQVQLQGNRQTGIGNVGTSLFPDVSSIFFNPGAMSFTNSGVMFGGSFIFSGNTYYDSETPNSTYTANTDNAVGTPFYFYGLWNLNKKFSAGLGVYTPFGSGVSWGEDWKGEDVLREISLTSIYIQPTLSYQITDNLGIGAGFVYAIGNVNLQRGLPINGQEVDPAAELDGSASGMGFNVGVFYKPNSQWNFGLNYRSQVDMEVEDGSANFTVPSALQNVFPATSFQATLPLPAVWAAGITYYPSQKLSITGEANLVEWSAYQSLDFDFEASQINDTESPRNYEDSWVLKLGGEYQLNDHIALRAGGYYDFSPVQPGFMTPETPDANRIGLTVGIGYKPIANLQIDLSFLYINGQERTQTLAEAQEAGTINMEEGRFDVLPGTYQLNALIPGISVGYNF